MGVSWRFGVVDGGYNKQGYNENGYSFNVVPSYDSRLFDVQLTDAYNRFARKAVATLDDPDGTVRSEYPHPTPVSLEVKRDVDAGYTRQLGGFVAKAESSSSGDRVDLTIHSHDQWIKNADPVFRSYTSTKISTIVEDLVGDKTPLDTPPGSITVVNDNQIDASWSGESLDEVLDELTAASAGEDYGATDTREFYFEPRSSSSAPRDFTRGEYFDADFSDDSTKEVNRVTVYYGGSAGSAVQVDDSSSQKNLQEELGTTSPVVVSAKPKSYPDITTESVAYRKGENILADRSEIQTGEITTWEAFDCEPGDVTRVVNPSQGVDSSYAIAEITYAWRADETKIKLAENSDGVVDQLVAMSNTIQRLDSRAANPDATITRFEQLSVDSLADLELEVIKRSIPDEQFSLGDFHGGFGDPAVGGGLLGDQSGPEETIRTV